MNDCRVEGGSSCLQLRSSYIMFKISERARFRPGSLFSFVGVCVALT